jgi:hypothetical protein
MSLANGKESHETASEFCKQRDESQDHGWVLDTME